MGDEFFERIIERINELKISDNDNDNDVEKITTTVKRHCTLNQDSYLYVHSERERKKKPYSSDRDAQFLRHIARVLYIQVNYDLNEKYPMFYNEILVEVQIMLATTNQNTKRMFVSFNAKPKNNGNDSDSDVVTFILTKLKALLDGELRETIDRSSGKLPENSDSKNYDHKYSLYRLKRHKEDCNEVYQLLNNSVEVLPPTPIDRHAEETLCDKAVELRGVSENSNMRFQIQGKMRPCKSCAGRMKSIGIEKYNRNSGFFLLTVSKNSCKKRIFQQL